MILPTTQADDIATARRMGSLYDARGLGVLPSRADEKRPLVRFAQYWESRPPLSLLDEFPTTNLQILCGRFYRLLVIDLDGSEAKAWWAARPERKPRTWVTHSGGDGEHWWFRLPENHGKPLRFGKLWEGEGKHSAVDRLCDKSLVVAPPSIHPTTGAKYRFKSKDQSPFGMGLPADCPKWLLDFPTIAAPRVEREVVPMARAAALSPGSGRYRPADVRDAIPDIIGLVASWGVEFGPDTGREYVPCRAIGRRDDKMSGGVSKLTGSYNDKGTGLNLGLFDLAATLGVAGDWKEAVASLGDRYHARQSAIAS